MGSLFDGIGGFPLAASKYGIETIWASEIEKFPIEVTKTHFPNMLHLGDITKINGAEIPPVDIITAGFPCQDISVAKGNREGLKGSRSGLFFQIIRIIKEMREAEIGRGKANEFIRPRYFIGENVPGIYSSNDGEDFRTVLEEITKIKDDTIYVPKSDDGKWESAGGIILGDEFSLAWITLRAEFFGVAQRRNRVFITCDFAGTSAPEILFKQESLLGNFTPSKA